jgi:hemoglobin
MLLDSREAIQKLIDSFYEKVKADKLLAPVFMHVDWPQHLSVMYNFWCSMMLGDQSYRGKPFKRHVHLKLQQAHFDQWLKLFIETVDENAEGEKAMEIKDRAKKHCCRMVLSAWSFKT